MRDLTKSFLTEKLSLALNPKNDVIIHPRQGIYFLGVDIFPYGRRLKKRNWKKILENLNLRNSLKLFRVGQKTLENQKG